MADRTIALDEKTDRDHDRTRQFSARPRTSGAAVFSLVFGLCALFFALAIIPAPLAVVFGLIGLILGVAGRRKARNDRFVTGSGIAAAGLVLSVIGLVLGIALTATVVTFLSDPQNLNQIQDQLRELSNVR